MPATATATATAAPSIDAKLRSARIARRAIKLQDRAIDRAIGRAYDAWAAIDYDCQLGPIGDAIGDLIQILNDAGVALAKLDERVNSRRAKF